jgi:hypothetical protein
MMPVIASEAKQSSSGFDSGSELDCLVASLLAMTERERDGA